jgi:hypothetical protein
MLQKEDFFADRTCVPIREKAFNYSRSLYANERKNLAERSLCAKMRKILFRTNLCAEMEDSLLTEACMPIRENVCEVGNTC